jgi:hypothetical protein
MLISPVNIEVGKFYEVPCVKADGRIMPVLLPSHTETENGCLHPLPEHYHIDFRFVKIKDFEYNAWRTEYCSSPFYKRLKSIKSSFNSLEEGGESAFFLINRWYTRFNDIIVQDNRCPHRNTQLVNACGTCPAHGLPWNLETKRLKEFKLPFYLELTKDGNHSLSNPFGIMKDNSCEITVKADFEGDTIIMVDSNGVKCTNATQILRTKFFKAETIIILNAKEICG